MTKGRRNTGHFCFRTLLVHPTTRDPRHVVVVPDAQIDGAVPPPDPIAKEREDGDPPAREPRRRGDGLDRHRIDDAIHFEIRITPEPLGGPALKRQDPFLEVVVPPPARGQRSGLAI